MTHFFVAILTCSQEIYEIDFKSYIIYRLSVWKSAKKYVSIILWGLFINDINRLFFGRNEPTHEYILLHIKLFNILLPQILANVSQPLWTLRHLWTALYLFFGSVYDISSQISKHHWVTHKYHWRIAKRIDCRHFSIKLTYFLHLSEHFQQHLLLND